MCNVISPIMSIIYSSILVLFLSDLAVSLDPLYPGNISLVNPRFSYFPTDIIHDRKCQVLYQICVQLRDDLDALECAHTYQEGPNHVSVDIDGECQHIIWSRTVDLLTDNKLKSIVKQFCTQESIYAKCVVQSPDNFLNCLFENINEEKNKQCSEFVERLKFLTFLDQRAMFMFIDSCKADIDRFNCGRLSKNAKFGSGSSTLSCLQKHILEIQKGCQSQVLRLSELQAENIEYDRQLLMSCARERKLYCSELLGKGLTYKCLIQHKDDQGMTSNCVKELVRHEQLIVQDYQVSRGLVRACKEDIRINRCRKSVSDDRDIRLAQILLCLENATHNGSTVVRKKCRDEMFAHRKMLLEDYRISPEIVSACSQDIINLCEGSLATGGHTIHCLMEKSRARKRKNRVSDQCQRQLEILIKETDAGEDWRVDPVLWKACQNVVTFGCNKYDPADPRVMECLMEHLDTEVMTADCGQSLRQLQYFVARDFRLDPLLYKACRESALRYCSAKPAWASSSAQIDPDKGPLILPCLYSKLTSSNFKLNEECVVELKRVMRQRAVSVGLNPDIELYCLDDLSQFCVGKTGKGEEMLCLQDNLESLSPQCKIQVFNFTEIQSEHIELNPIIATNCKIVIEDLCGDALNKGKSQNIIDCLIEHKNDQLMKIHNKCRASVEHHQLISLKDYHFTLKFKKACKDHVSRFCPGAKNKAEVVRCLSEVIRNETLADSKPKVSKECHQQLKQQLLQQRESIELNPRLKADCTRDIRRLCSSLHPGNAKVLECLMSNKRNLSNECWRRIFNVEKQDLADSSTDYTLMTVCKAMLDKYCNKTEEQPLACLRKYKYNVEFDYKCRNVVLKRISEQNSDSRLNPGLQTDCRRDISRYCTETLEVRTDNLEENVISCLKIQFRAGKLEQKCKNQVISILQEAALNYQLNPLLKTACSSEIRQYCETEEDKLGRGQVEECLKEALKNGQITNVFCKQEIFELVEESKADVRADPHLYKACNKDIVQYCSSVPEGNGRQLDCLIDIVHSKPNNLQKQCENTLKERIEMYKIVAPKRMENFSQLYGQVSHSPSKKYFMVVALTFIGMIFISGMFCGRALKRTIAGKRK